MPTFKVPETVHVELCTPDGVVAAEFTAGEHTPTTPDDEYALSVLAQIGAAEPIKSRPRRSSKED